MLNKSLLNGLAANYHNNTRNINNIGRYDMLTQYKIYPSAKKIKFETIQSCMNSDFVQILLRRQSYRVFGEDSITLNQLGSLLSLSFGLNHMEDAGLHLRTYPSAGGRYPIEVYLVILRSEDLPAGIYHYNVADNSIELIKRGHFDTDLNNFYENQPLFGNVSCYILFSMVYERTMNKYGERGYRFMCIDAGHMGQNLYLVAEHLGLGVVALGGGKSSDKYIDDLLSINDYEESFFYGFAVGIPEKNDCNMVFNNNRKTVY